MSAAEYGLPSPAGAPSWISLAQNVFSDMHDRWDTTSCNGGLKGQILSSSPGYDYKNSISNGLYFQLSVRLAKLTGSPEYVTAAEQVFEWVQSVGLVDENYNVYDGTDDTKGCTSVDHDQRSYIVGAYLYGSAVMQALTNDPKWVTRTNGLRRDIHLLSGQRHGREMRAGRYMQCGPAELQGLPFALAGCDFGSVASDGWDNSPPTPGVGQRGCGFTWSYTPRHNHLSTHSRIKRILMVERSNATQDGICVSRRIRHMRYKTRGAIAQTHRRTFSRTRRTRTPSSRVS
jgi:hypothetical protein